MSVVNPIRIISFTILVSMILGRVISAEVRVYPDQYIIRPKVLAAASSGNIDAALSAQGLQSIRTIDSSGMRLVTPSIVAKASFTQKAQNQAVEYNADSDLCPEIIKRGLAESCSPNFQLHIDSTPNDSSYSSLWGLSSDKGIDAPSAWDVTTGSSDVVVAIIDTGVDYNHPELRDNMWANPGETPGNGIDDDANGYIDDVYGWNSSKNNGNPMDDNGHGTHVAGTIGAVGNNGLGVAGINWRVKIMACKFLDRDGSGSLADAVSALDYVIKMKRRGVNVRLTNNSWGGGGFAQALFDSISKADREGILFIAAAGNESVDNDSTDSYPADYQVSNVVSVAAIDREHNLASFSNYGAESVDIAAPGVGILSTVPHSSYATYSGTSMATPHVTGALALLLASEPSLGSSELLARLYDSGSEASTLDGLVRTRRILNVGRMLHNQTLPLPTPAPGSEGCAYNMQEMTYAPDRSADGSPIVIQADEANFYTLDLPFAFPFEGKEVTKVYISPNGVVYRDRAPSSMDFRNGSNAPRNSIAALHADLTAIEDPEGVRVFTDAGRAVIYWSMKHFSRLSGRDVEVRLVLHSDGTIENFINFGDSTIERAVSAAATIGISGGALSSALTYASNNSRIRDNLAVSFTSMCGQSMPDVPRVSRVGVYGIKGKKLLRQVKSKQTRSISVRGSGSGSVQVQPTVNNSVCALTSTVNLSSGLAAFKASVPALSGSITKIGFLVGGAKDQVPVVDSKRSGKRSKASARELSKVCSGLINSMR